MYLNNFHLFTEEMDVNWDDGSWWAGALEEDTAWSFELEDDVHNWAENFIPPPPRPAFLDRDIPPDGVTTCDLCSWATSTLYSTTLVPWSITLIVVSILSALLGAILMVTLRHCYKRINSAQRYADSRTGGVNSGLERREESKLSVRGGGGGGNRGGEGGRGVWCWMNRRPALAAPTETPATNHYTVDEALYAELDKPVYQNTGYVLTDGETGSPPSSAYYSDLSERTYETVGGGGGGSGGGTIGVTQWEMGPLSRQRLAAISETAPIHSDYV
ncbi:hypothetical protein O3M35_002644 [Rhynocoris fuscipes]|uniref:Uncharacterized protein n=1 Tax=Rhynocoris fuscipes TaxID=488301 RepID=A0AAW1CL09_9HEMI